MVEALNTPQRLPVLLQSERDTIQCGLNVVVSQGLVTYIYICIRVSDILSADL